MSRRWVIDGNNLLHAMHAHAPLPRVGRESLLRIVEQWARLNQDVVTIVFDGFKPGGGLGRQFSSKSVHVVFSERRTADDVIVELLHGATDPGRLTIVSADGAIVREARHARCAEETPMEFIRRLFPPLLRESTKTSDPLEKPQTMQPEEVDEFLRMMDAADLEFSDDRELFGAN